MSTIKNIEIRACRGGDQLNPHNAVDAVQLPGGSRPDFTVVTITTEEGITGTSFGFGALDAKVAAATMSQVKPFFIGRSPHDAAKNMKDFELFDRRWNHVPIYSYAPFDNACWDIVGKMAHQPVYKLLGASEKKFHSMSHQCSYLDLRNMCNRLSRLNPKAIKVTNCTLRETWS